MWIWGKEVQGSPTDKKVTPYANVQLWSKYWLLLCPLMKSSPANIYLFQFSKRNTRKRCGICSKLTLKTPGRRRCRSGVLLLTLDIFHTLSSVFIFDFLQLNIAGYCLWTRINPWAGKFSYLVCQRYRIQSTDFTFKTLDLGFHLV